MDEGLSGKEDCNLESGGNQKKMGHGGGVSQFLSRWVLPSIRGRTNKAGKKLGGLF